MCVHSIIPTNHHTNLRIQPGVVQIFEVLASMRLQHALEEAFRPLKHAQVEDGHAIVLANIAHQKVGSLAQLLSPPAVQEQAYDVSMMTYGGGVTIRGDCDCVDAFETRLRSRIHK